MPRIFGNTLLCLGFLGLAGACSSSGKAPYEVVFDQDVTIVMKNDQEKPVKQGERVELTEGPLTVLRNGSNPLILLPLPKERGTMTLKLPKDGKGTGGPADFDVNRLAQNILWIQNLIVEGRVDDALIKIQDIRDKFKDLSYVRFLEASAYLAKGQVGKAQETCEAALKDFPDDEVGRQFLKQLLLLTSSASSIKENNP